MEGMKNVQVKKREVRCWKEEILGCFLILMNTTAVCMTTVCWGGVSIGVWEGGEGDYGKKWSGY